MNEHAYAVLEAVTWLEVLNPKEHVEASETIAGHAKFFSASGAPTGTETRVRKVLGRDGKEHTRRYLVPLPPHLERWSHSLITAGQADLASLIERQFRDLEQKLTRWRASCAEAIEQWRWDNQLICMGELPDNLRAVIGDHLCDDLDEITYSAATLSRLIEQVIDQQGVESSDPPLSDTDVAILSELLALGATADAPQTREVVARRLNWKGEGKRAFDPLKKLGYVAGCRHGFYLTESGKIRAKSMA